MGEGWSWSVLDTPPSPTCWHSIDILNAIYVCSITFEINPVLPNSHPLRMSDLDLDLQGHLVHLLMLGHTITFEWINPVLPNSLQLCITTASEPLLNINGFDCDLQSHFVLLLIVILEHVRPVIPELIYLFSPNSHQLCIIVGERTLCNLKDHDLEVYSYFYWYAQPSSILFVYSNFWMNKRVLPRNVGWGVMLCSVALLLTGIALRNYYTVFRLSTAWKSSEACRTRVGCLPQIWCRSISCAMTG